MSHYLGVVILPGEPTVEALAEIMEDHKDRHWDWYRPGGRWDGWLVGDDEMEARETDNGFNFADENKRIDKNICRASELPTDRLPYFFIAGWAWVSKEGYVDGYPTGRFEANSQFEAQYAQARTDKPDAWAIVIDAHN